VEKENNQKSSKEKIVEKVYNFAIKKLRDNIEENE